MLAYLKMAVLGAALAGAVVVHVMVSPWEDPAKVDEALEWIATNCKPWISDDPKYEDKFEKSPFRQVGAAEIRKAFAKMPPRSDKADHAAYKEDAAYKAVRNAFTVCVLKVAPDKNPPDQKDHFTKLQQDLKAKNDVLDKWVENNLYKPKPDDTGDGTTPTSTATAAPSGKPASGTTTTSCLLAAAVLVAHVVLL